MIGQFQPSRFFPKVRIVLVLAIVLVIEAPFFPSLALSQSPAVPSETEVSAAPLPQAPEVPAAPPMEDEGLQADETLVHQVQSTPTPAHPISDLFVDVVATPTPTPTSTPPPEAFATPVLSSTAPLNESAIPAGNTPASATPPEAEIAQAAAPNPIQEAPDPAPAPQDIAASAPTDVPNNAAALETPPAPMATPIPAPTETIPPAATSAPTATLLPTATPVPTPTTVPDTQKVDLNTATEQQLMGLPGIDSYRARLIVLHRQAILGFARSDQLMDVYGISEQMYHQIAPLVKVGSRAGFSNGTLQTEIPAVQPLQTPVPPTMPSLPNLPSTSGSIPAPASQDALVLPQ